MFGNILVITEKLSPTPFELIKLIILLKQTVAMSQIFIFKRLKTTI